MKNKVINSVLNALWGIKIVFLMLCTFECYSSLEWGWLFVWVPEIAISCVLIMRQIEAMKKQERKNEYSVERRDAI